MKRLFLVIFLVIAGLLFLNFQGYSLTNAEEGIKLYLGEIKIVPTNNPMRIVIGNPSIVDIANLTKKEITLSPKAAGNTTLVFWDNDGEHSYRVRVLSEDITEARRRIDSLLGKINLPGVYTQEAEDESKVLLLGNVKSPKDREKISIVLGPLKEKTIDLIEVREEEAAVEIDVQVLELDKDATNTLGFTWPGSVNFIEVGSAAISASGTQWPDLFKIANVQRGTSAAVDPLTLKVDFLVQEGKARILSRPRLACQSGKEAELLVGGEKPIFTTEVAAVGGQGTNVEYKEYGIKLKMKPTITDDNRVKLALNVEVSEVGTAETIGTTSLTSTVTTALAYPLSKRNASTELYLDDGQTMAIGGLIKQKTEEDIRKTPWLGDLPVIGSLFRKKTTKTGGGAGERGNTELFIILTPRIISKEKAPKATEVIESKIEPAPEELPAQAVVIDAADPVTKYAMIIQNRILESLTYPNAAKQAGFQGTVKLGLHLAHNGQLIGVKIKDSSGYKILDDDALAIAKAITSYPPFPTALEQEELWVNIPIMYRLD